MSEREDFTGQPNLKEFEFRYCGDQFKVSNWYDLKVGDGGAKVEQDGALLSFDCRMSHDMRKPFFDLEVTVDQKKHRLEIFFFWPLVTSDSMSNRWVCCLRPRENSCLRVAAGSDQSLRTKVGGKVL